MCLTPAFSKMVLTTLPFTILQVWGGAIGWQQDETNLIWDGTAAVVQVPIKDGRWSKEASDDFAIKAFSGVK